MLLRSTRVGASRSVFARHNYCILFYHSLYVAKNVDIVNSRNLTSTPSSLAAKEETSPHNHDNIIIKSVTLTSILASSLLSSRHYGAIVRSKRLTLQKQPTLDSTPKLQPAWLFYLSLLTQEIGIVWRAFLEGPQRPNRDQGLDLFIRSCRHHGLNKNITIQRVRDAMTTLYKLGEKMVPHLLKDLNIREVQWTVGETSDTVRIRDIDLDKDEPHEWTVSADWIEHKLVPANEKNDMVLLFMHGGAYSLGSKDLYRPALVSVAKQLGCHIFNVLAPDHPFPAALHDSVSAYLYLTEKVGIRPSKIILAGDSAGGNLAMVTMLYLRDRGYPMPGGAILLSPWSDLTHDLASIQENKEYDFINVTNENSSIKPVSLFLGTDDYMEIARHPYISPVYDNCHGLPPIMISTGTDEIFLDENILLAIKLAKAGNTVRHEIYEDQVHVFMLIAPHSSDAVLHLTSMARFMADAHRRSLASTAIDNQQELANHKPAQRPNKAGFPIDQAKTDKMPMHGSDRPRHRFVYLRNQQESSATQFCRRHWEKIRHVKGLSWDVGRVLDDGGAESEAEHG